MSLTQKLKIKEQKRFEDWIISEVARDSTPKQFDQFLKSKPFIKIHGNYGNSHIANTWAAWLKAVQPAYAALNIIESGVTTTVDDEKAEPIVSEVMKQTKLLSQYKIRLRELESKILK